MCSSTAAWTIPVYVVSLLVRIKTLNLKFNVQHNTDDMHHIQVLSARMPFKFNYIRQESVSTAIFSAFILVGGGVVVSFFFWENLSFLIISN